MNFRTLKEVIENRKLNEQVSIKNGSLRGANASSDLDRKNRTHHPYHWAADAFARARISQDWEQVPEQTDAQTQKKLEKLNFEDQLKRYIDATIVYSKEKKDGSMEPVQSLNPIEKIWYKSSNPI